jgi:mannobiose 2-epimerase
MPDVLVNFMKEVTDEVQNDILKFWIDNAVDEENGGFFGSISDNLSVNKTAPKGAVLLSRILWTYSQAFIVFGKPEYIKMAERAYAYLIEHAVDKKNGGVFWLLDHKGQPLESKKQIYAHAFAIYALVEYFGATKNIDALNHAVDLFNLLEKHANDKKYKGYYDACDMVWKLPDDMSLSMKDLNCRKSMNTNLHVLEAFTNLARHSSFISDNKTVMLIENRLKELIDVTIDHIVDNSTYHFMMYFDDEWNSLKDHISYGHDIEGSWLLYEAAVVCGDKDLIDRTKEISIKMAETTYNEGIDKDGAIVNDGDKNGITDPSRDWWPQAEAMVGFFNAYELTGEKKYLNASLNVWNFVKSKFIDKKYGEWYWSVDENGIYKGSLEKTGMWKCPYHNSRTCFEIIRRIKEIFGKRGC